MTKNQKETTREAAEEENTLIHSVQPQIKNNNQQKKTIIKPENDNTDKMQLLIPTIQKNIPRNTSIISKSFIVMPDDDSTSSSKETSDLSELYQKYRTNFSFKNQDEKKLIKPYTETDQKSITGPNFPTIFQNLLTQSNAPSMDESSSYSQVSEQLLQRQISTNIDDLDF
eukprot:UN29860